MISLSFALSSSPSGVRISLPKCSSIEFREGLPFSTTTLEARSASTIVIPNASKLSETAVFPLPIPPVKPIIITSIVSKGRLD